MIHYVGEIDGAINVIEIDDGTPVITEINFTEQDTEILEIIKKEEYKKEIVILKQKLFDTDYIACKIAEGAATKEEYAFELEARRGWRARINELEQLLK